MEAFALFYAVMCIAYAAMVAIPKYGFYRYGDEITLSIFDLLLFPSYISVCLIHCYFIFFQNAD